MRHNHLAQYWIGHIIFFTRAIDRPYRSFFIVLLLLSFYYGGAIWKKQSAMKDITKLITD